MCIFSKGFWNTSFPPKQSGASDPIYKLQTSFACIQVPSPHPSFDLLLIVLIFFPPVNTLSPLEGTFIILGTMQFTKWCSSYGNAPKDPWGETKELSKHILIILWLMLSYLISQELSLNWSIWSVIHKAGDIFLALLWFKSLGGGNNCFKQSLVLKEAWVQNGIQRI